MQSCKDGGGIDAELQAYITAQILRRLLRDRTGRRETGNALIKAQKWGEYEIHCDSGRRDGGRAD